MNTVKQTSLFDNEQVAATTKTKRYTVQKYRVSYVKENTSMDKRCMLSKTDVLAFCKNTLSDLPLENVCIIALDTGNNIIGYDCVEGATNQCALYPANVFRFLLSAAASSYIIAHNHPGGSLSASQADWNITERLRSAGKLLDIPLIDHLIITEDSHISLKDSRKWD